MKKLRRSFARFLYNNRDKGIPNLMLYISIGTAIVYLMSMRTPALYNLLCFDRYSILHGQVWRLLTFPLTNSSGNILFTFVMLLCYYSLGRAMEASWGTLRFNLFYLTGIVLMDVYCMIFGGYATAEYLNLSLFLAFATTYPNTQFLLLFIIPVRAWILALVYLVIVLVELLFSPFPYNLFPVVALLNYFLFFGKDVLNVVPLSWQMNVRRLFKKTAPGRKGKTIPFPSAGSYQATNAKPKAPYTHKCTICGRTDVSNPELEFRYCSRCSGYHCYCSEHISNHEHIAE